MEIVKILISFLIGVITTFFITIYSLEVVNIEITEGGEIVTIKLLNDYENYYIKK
ncbi:MAG: hypothetical protein MSS80_08235 [Mollicutes bacterium]|nr:hypothetical protein [Mollicutes bacterium]